MKHWENIIKQNEILPNYAYLVFEIAKWCPYCFRCLMNQSKILKECITTVSQGVMISSTEIIKLGL